MDLSKHFVLLNGEPKTLQIDTIQKYLLSKTTSICVGRYGRLRRSIRTSAPVDADVCVGRYGHPRRSMRTSASVDADAQQQT